MQKGYQTRNNQQAGVSCKPLMLGFTHAWKAVSGQAAFGQQRSLEQGSPFGYSIR